MHPKGGQFVFGQLASQGGEEQRAASSEPAAGKQTASCLGRCLEIPLERRLRCRAEGPGAVACPGGNTGCGIGKLGGGFPRVSLAFPRSIPSLLAGSAGGEAEEQAPTNPPGAVRVKPGAVLRQPRSTSSSTYENDECSSQPCDEEIQT